MSIRPRFRFGLTEFGQTEFVLTKNVLFKLRVIAAEDRFALANQFKSKQNKLYMKKLTINVTRDSVCSADDMNSPHLRRFRIESDGTIAEVILHLQKQYVPLNIQGGKSTWLVEADQALAVIAQQWEHPVFLIDPNTRISDGIKLKSQTPLYAHYFGSVNPVSLLQYLILGEPFPRGLDLYQTEKLKKMCPLKCTSQL